VTVKDARGRFMVEVMTREELQGEVERSRSALDKLTTFEIASEAPDGAYKAVLAMREVANSVNKRISVKEWPQAQPWQCLRCKNDHADCRCPPQQRGIET
jgi:hypothetical protein